MHLPTHPLWFWLVITSPFITWTALWAVSRFGRVSLRPLTQLLIVGMILSFPVFIVLGSPGSHKASYLFAQAVFYSCWTGATWIRQRYVFETLRGPSGKWYIPWSAARFSIPENVRIAIRDMDYVAPWYADKLGLRRAAGASPAESGTATYKFNPDGKSIVLTTKTNYTTDRPLILFTKKIGRMRGILSERGVNVGPIEQDRQGTGYFEIHDPEGNAIEVVEEF